MKYLLSVNQKKIKFKYSVHFISICFIIVGLYFQSCNKDEADNGEINYRYKKVFSGNRLIYEYEYNENGSIHSIIDYGPKRTYFFFYRPDGKLDSIGNPEYWKKFYYDTNGDLEYFIGNQVTPGGYKGEYIFKDGKINEFRGYEDGELKSKFYYSYFETGYMRVDSTFNGFNFSLSTTSTYTFYTDLNVKYFPQRTPFSDEANFLLPDNWVEKSFTVKFRDQSIVGTSSSYEVDKYGRIVKQKFTGIGGQSDYEFSFRY